MTTTHCTGCITYPVPILLMCAHCGTPTERMGIHVLSVVCAPCVVALGGPTATSDWLQAHPTPLSRVDTHLTIGT